MAAIRLIYRLRCGKRHGPYGVSDGQYLGAVTVQDRNVFRKSNGEFVGQLPEVSEPRVIDIKTAIRDMFYFPRLTHQNIEDIKLELQSRFSGESVERAVADMVRKGILQRVCPGNYRTVI